MAPAQLSTIGVRLAFFSPARAFAQSATGKTAQARLTALQMKRTKEVDSRTKSLQAQRQQLQQNASVLTEQARAQREKELERIEIDLQRFIQDAQAEIAGVQRDIESEFLTRLRPALEQVATSQSLWLVFNGDAGLLAWDDLALDITTEVVKRIDAR